MRYKGINLGNVKNSNRSSILRLLNSEGAMPRKDIAEQVGLTAASVTLICTELLEEGVIREIGEVEEEKRAGRKKILVDINHEYKKILCISIEANESYIAVTNLSGQILGEITVNTQVELEPEEFMKKIADESKKLLWEKGLGREEILGVGLSVPGRVNRQTGVNSKGFSIWPEDVAIGPMLEEELGLPVVVENNIKAHAEEELQFGFGRTSEHIALLKWGPGVGSAFIMNNQIYQGATGSAAELGHMPMGRRKKACKCGRCGCLETEISTHAIIESIMEAYHSCKNPQEEMEILHKWLKSGNQMTYRNVKEWALLQDAKLQAILDEKIDILAHAVRNTVSLLDPNQIVVYGYLFDVPHFLERLTKAYANYDTTKGKDFFVRSEIAEKFKHLEALSIVMDEFFF